ncbi:GGDEF domain-containing protein [Glaciibacter sp. 2TAF33]|uniref:GGDEF domain-containing protein n=1 Tax=Glaciibacter sp. 2TAF33 TaxID=3233015 RepID=UPI003F9257EE
MIGTPADASGAGLIERESDRTVGAGALVQSSEFGVFDALADRAHQLYLTGYSERAVHACRAWRLATQSAGDTVTTRYLSYIEGVALQELGRHHDAVTVAMDLLVDLDDDDPDPMWRAKALALLAEASSQAREVSRAMDALAEASWLVSVAQHGKYSHLSASTAVAVALRAVFLFEQADELMAAITLGDDMDIDLLVVQERALLAAFWATTLLVVGRAHESGPHLVRCAELALRMGRIAALVGNTEMFARAGVIEAYALSRLGYTDLAAARVNAVIGNFPLRDDLVETHLARLVLGQAATESGDFPEARQQLRAAMATADRASREIWAAAALEALANLEVAEHGQHPAVDLWKRLSREALERVWIERDGRFTALQTRNQVRALTAETSRMGQAALLDPLTGLGNRHMMANAIESAGDSFSALFIDVDDFKQVNDRFSHDVGDEVLRRIAVILRSHCRADDIPVRYGGDEFVVLVFGDGAAADGVAERFHRAVRTAPWGQVATGLRVTVSVGVGGAGPDRGAIAAADAALYVAKGAGRDCVVTA